MMRHIDDPVFRIEPDDIYREQHVLHPDAVYAWFRVNKKKPGVLIQALPVTEASYPFFQGVGNLDFEF